MHRKQNIIRRPEIDECSIKEPPTRGERNFKQLTQAYWDLFST